ncbi:MAG TPA: helix-turn-helix domain-containing protein [Chitinophagaceae bacterium]|nr:helix-turn-helix domain-containing protein [Chitinophagaceae bacterium]
MNHHYQQPLPHLSPYIKTILVLEDSAPPDDTTLPLFTNGMPALICRTEKEQNGNENITQLALLGTSAPANCWEISCNTTLIAYFFKPFVLPCIFNIAAAKLKESPVDLRIWEPHKTNALITQLTYATTTSQKIAVLDNLLAHQLQQQKKECAIIQSATDRIMHNSCTEILSDILHELNLNERTFQRMFKKYVGVTPNQFRRICQFQLSFAQLRTGQFDNLSGVAYDCGFADQSHFIRSFKEFTQTTPNNYLRFGLKLKDR